MQLSIDWSKPVPLRSGKNLGLIYTLEKPRVSEVESRVISIICD